MWYDCGPNGYVDLNKLIKIQRVRQGYELLFEHMVCVNVPDQIGENIIETLYGSS